MPDWGALRAEFPLLDRCIYFNACSLGPLPRSGRAALARYGQDWDEQGTPVWFTTWLPLLDRFRGRVAELLQAPAGSTAIAPSVSVALSTLATGLPLPKGRDKVLIGELDFPTVGHQWLRRPGFEVDVVPSPAGMTMPPWALADGDLGDGMPLRGTGRPGTGPGSWCGQHPGEAARPDRPHPRALRRGRRPHLHAPRARAPMRHRDPGMRAARGGGGKPSRGGCDRRLPPRPDPPVTPLVRDGTGAGTGHGPRHHFPLPSMGGGSGEVRLRKK